MDFESCANSSTCNSVRGNRPKLPASKKEEVVRAILANERSVDDVVDECQVTRNTIYQWCYKFRRGKPLKDQIGRPKLLDDYGLDAMHQQLNSSASMKESKLEYIIQEEYRDSQRRNRLAYWYDETERKFKQEMSRRSQLNYLKAFSRHIEVVRENQGGNDELH